MATVIEFGAPEVAPMCGLVSCSEPAKCQILIRVPLPNMQHLEIYLGHGACSTHLETLRASDVLTPVVWKHIADTMARSGYEVPPRDSVRVRFESMGGIIIREEAS